MAPPDTRIRPALTYKRVLLPLLERTVNMSQNWTVDSALVLLGRP